jgi:arginyl-tRNA synthetase
MNLLRQKGHVTERDGAVWFASSDLGEDKDNVLVRSNGQPTYFASDIAYHYDKFIRRGFDRVIDVWSADHQGHVPRMKAVVGALGIDPDRLTLMIYQLVNLVRDGKPVRMGKRTGEFVTLGEVLDDVGSDAVRFFLVARSADAMMDFDLDLAKQQSNDNPVYYVQYAHARVSSILRSAEEIEAGEVNLALLEHESELALLRKMGQLPEVIELAATTLAPHHLPYYAQEVASAFHAFYRDCRVLSDDIPLTQARLALVRACQIVLANSLKLIGVSTPEKM